MTPLRQLLGESAAITAVREQVTRLLRSAAGGRRLPPILILGETGTGKGLLAAAIHGQSARAAAPFVDVNCAAIPEPLLEAELFGFERGAFTDARQAKPGLFQTASSGTIFLDEVGLLPLGLQAKLLKVLEERSVRRLGSTRSEPLDVCLVAATSEDLPAAVAESRFRADLYHRLAVVALTLPPLRGRGQDVLLLAQHFLARVCEDYGLPPRTLGEDARQALLLHEWPGNVRELANVLERAALLTDDATISAAGLGLPGWAAPAVQAEGVERAGAEAGGDPADEERGRLLDALRASDWNFSRVAARLGVPRNTLRYRAERLGLTPDGPPGRRRGGRPPASRPTREQANPAAVPPAETRRVTLLAARLEPGADGAAASDMVRALGAIADKVRTFGGRVEEQDASGLVAAFGLVPEEDAPRRAAHAAVAVQRLAARARASDARLPDVRLALHTEPLRLVRAAEASEIDPAARHEAWRTLGALIEAAEPGTVVASVAAAHFLARRFDLVSIGSPSGEAAAVRVLGQSDRERTRFVGRTPELQLLGERFRLAQGGQGQVVVIVGEPGIGKSRLLREFRQRLGSAATWIEGQALAFGQAMAFHPVIDMLRRAFRIDEADAEPVVVEKIERSVRRLGAEAVPALPYIRYLLSADPGDPAVLAMDPKQRHAEIVRASQLLLARGAELRPHVVVVEDVHWCDVATEDWLTRLGDGVVARRVLLVLTCRPGYRAPFGGRSFHTGVALATLSGDDTLGLVRSLLDTEEVPAALGALVVDKAEGNPFFVEELVQSLQELGAVRREGNRVVVSPDLDDGAVPDTVEEVLLARMRRLDERLRRVIEVASVIGRNVPFSLLGALTGRPEAALGADLRRLGEAEFLYEVRTFPEVEHTFKHALTQDVAYASLPAEERRALHARIVAAIEQLFPRRLEEHAERLAHHALRGEEWERAVRYGRLAFAKAFDRSANLEAVRSLEQVLAALERLPETRDTIATAIDVRLALRSALLQLGQVRRITQHLQEAEVLATAAGERTRLGWVWTYLTISYLFLGDLGRALDVGARALAVAEEVGDFGLVVTARTPLAHARHERGDLRAAVALLEATIAALAGDRVRERLGQAMPPALYARNIAAVCLADLGELAEAERLAGEAARFAETLDLPFGLALARIALGHTRLTAGRLDEADQVLGLALQLIEARGMPTWFPWAAATRGRAMTLAGRAAEAVPLLEQALARAVALPFLCGHSQWTAWLAHAHLALGRIDEAVRLGQEAVGLSRQRGERGYEASALATLAEITARSEPASAEALYREAQALAGSLGMLPLATHCERAVAEIARPGYSSWAPPRPP